MMTAAFVSFAVKWIGCFLNLFVWLLAHRMICRTLLCTRSGGRCMLWRRSRLWRGCAAVETGDYGSGNAEVYRLEDEMIAVFIDVFMNANYRELNANYPQIKMSEEVMMNWRKKTEVRRWRYGITTMSSIPIRWDWTATTIVITLSLRILKWYSLRCWDLRWSSQVRRFDDTMNTR